jgi:nicotinamide-nucleotide amidase
MADPPVSIILSVGTELTEGSILNTHFRFLGAEIKGMGFYTRRCVQIPDDPDIFRRELREAVQSSVLVIITGGLGPTSDDLTRDIVAEAAGVTLHFDSSIWEDLVARYSTQGRTIASTNRKQAHIPSGFQILPNAVGTAPGFCGQMGECMVIALPGPPLELEEMFLRQAVPLIKKRFFSAQDLQSGEIIATALMIPESVLELALQRISGTEGGMLWSTRVAHDRIVLTLRGSQPREQQRILTGLLDRFGSVRIRRGDVQPSRLLYDALLQREECIALAESCTGGLVSKLITDIPGSSRVFWGTLVTYSNEAKQSFLGIPEQVLNDSGAVSAEAASAMSEGLLQHTPADLGVAVTGIAGPEGGSEEKPVGTVWISARSRHREEICRAFHFHGSRDSIRRRSAVAALLLGECALLAVEPDLEY